LDPIAFFVGAAAPLFLAMSPAAVISVFGEDGTAIFDYAGSQHRQK
jgi:hypothetical protein